VLQRDEHGVALVLAVMTMTLMLSLGSALVLLSSSEMAIAANFRASHEAFYAADTVMERTIAELQIAPDWTTVLGGGVRSPFVDGDATGNRTLIDGATINLDQITNLANCEKETTCSDADRAAVTTARPWGLNNPQWVPFAYGPLRDSLDTANVYSPFYVIAFVADDPSENDDDPLQDGIAVAGQPNPGLGILVVRAEAFGPRRSHKALEATIRRTEMPSAPDEPVSTELHVLSWQELR
jgi:hypothetical protein